MACVLLCSAVTPRWAAHTIAVFVIRMHPVVHCRFTFALPVVYRAGNKLSRPWSASCACDSLLPSGIANAAAPLCSILSNGPQRRVRVIFRTGNKSSRSWPASEAAAGLAPARLACGSPWKSQVRLRSCAPLEHGPQRRVRVIDRTGNKSLPSQRSRAAPSSPDIILLTSLTPQVSSSHEVTLRLASQRLTLQA